MINKILKPSYLTEGNLMDWDKTTKREIEDILLSIRKLQENIRHLESAHNTHVQTLVDNVHLKYPQIEKGTDLYSLKNELVDSLKIKQTLQ